MNSICSASYNNIGISKADLKDFEGAVSDYTKAIELNPFYREAYYNRGIARYYLSDINGACQDARKAKSLLFDSSILIYAVCN